MSNPDTSPPGMEGIQSNRQKAGTHSELPTGSGSRDQFLNGATFLSLNQESARQGVMNKAGARETISAEQLFDRESNALLQRVEESVKASIETIRHPNVPVREKGIHAIRLLNEILGFGKDGFWGIMISTNSTGIQLADIQTAILRTMVANSVTMFELHNTVKLAAAEWPSTEPRTDVQSDTTEAKPAEKS